MQLTISVEDGCARQPRQPTARAGFQWYQGSSRCSPLPRFAWRTPPRIRDNPRNCRPTLVNMLHPSLTLTRCFNRKAEESGSVAPRSSRSDPRARTCWRPQLCTARGCRMPRARRRCTRPARAPTPPRRRTPYTRRDRPARCTVCGSCERIGTRVRRRWAGRGRWRQRWGTYSNVHSWGRSVRWMRCHLRTWCLRSQYP